MLLIVDAAVFSWHRNGFPVLVFVVRRKLAPYVGIQYKQLEPW